MLTQTLARSTVDFDGGGGSVVMFNYLPSQLLHRLDVVVLGKGMLVYSLLMPD